MGMHRLVYFVHHLIFATIKVCVCVCVRVCVCAYVCVVHIPRQGLRSRKGEDVVFGGVSGMGNEISSEMLAFWREDVLFGHFRAGGKKYFLR